MTYAELSEVQARRTRQFAEAQTDAMSAYCYAERDLKDLQAENDRLREVISDGEENARFILQESRALQAENAKLRELVADTLMQPRDYCQKYDIEYDSWDSVNEHLDARLRELGVEVEP